MSNGENSKDNHINKKRKLKKMSHEDSYFVHTFSSEFYTYNLSYSNYKSIQALNFKA